MKCYVCAKQGVEKSRGHLHRVRDGPLSWPCFQGGVTGEGYHRLGVRGGTNQYPHTLPRFICAECKLAIEQRKKVERK